jgi:hypothetical protein
MTLNPRGAILGIAEDYGVTISGITFTGISGRNYSYLIFDHTNERHMLQGSANYAFAAKDRLPIFFEATGNLKKSFLGENKDLWDHAQDVHGATLLLIHPGSDRDASDREKEKADLIARYHPPMNSRASELR